MSMGEEMISTTLMSVALRRGVLRMKSGDSSWFLSSTRVDVSKSM